MEQQNRNDALDRALTQQYDMPVPAGFQASWRAAIHQEEKQKMNTKKGFWKIALPIAATLVLVIGTIATGNLQSAQESAPLPLPKMASTRSASTADTSSYEAASGYTHEMS